MQKHIPFSSFHIVVICLPVSTRLYQGKTNTHLGYSGFGLKRQTNTHLGYSGFGLKRQQKKINLLSALWKNWANHLSSVLWWLLVSEQKWLPLGGRVGQAPCGESPRCGTPDGAELLPRPARNRQDLTAQDFPEDVLENPSLWTETLTLQSFFS